MKRTTFCTWSFSTLFVLLVIAMVQTSYELVQFDQYYTRYAEAYDLENIILDYVAVANPGTVLQQQDDTQPAVVVAASTANSIKNTPTAPDWMASRNSNKSLLVLHVGPPKTSTTTIQTAMYKLRDALAEDGYFAGGRFYDPFINEKNKTIINRMETDVLRYAHDMMHPRECEIAHRDCVANFKKELAKYKGQNVLLSDEAFSTQWSSKNPGSYQAIHDALKDEWDVVVIVAYRHFFEWVGSNLFQWQRLDSAAPRKDEWPGEGSEGKKLKRLFPEEVPACTEECESYTSKTLDHINNVVPVRVLNMHKSANVVENFFCNALPNAPRTCEESKKQVDDPFAVMNSKEGVMDPSYDLLTTAAAERGMIDTAKYTRKEIREALLLHVTEELNRDHQDFDMACPSSKVLDDFLNESLNRQRRTFGAEFDDEMEQQHRQAFQKKVDSDAFCSVDIDATLSNKQWKTFFERFSK